RQWLRQNPTDPEAKSYLQRAEALARGDKSAESMPVNGKYSPERVRNADIDYFFQHLGREPEPGFHQFAAMWALIDRATSGTQADKDAIIRKAAEHLDDQNTTDAARWHACYVLSGTGDPRVIPILARVLSGDKSVTERGVAACALGKFPQAEAHQAL